MRVNVGSEMPGDDEQVLHSLPNLLQVADEGFDKVSAHPLLLDQQENATPEAEFLDEIQTKVLRVFLLPIHSHLRSFAL